MKKLLLLILGVCLAKSSFAQNDFREGYIISNAGDTLFGFVDYTEGRQMSRLCHFKKADDQKVMTYEPGQITGFGLSDNLFFESKRVKDRNKVEQSVFVEVKVKGFVSLFRFDFEYYVEKNNGDFNDCQMKIRKYMSMELL